MVYRDTCEKVKCDCCGVETLAEIRGDKVVIFDRRHGRKHIVVLPLRQIVHEMKQFASSALSVFTVFEGHLSVHGCTRKVKCDCCGVETLAEVKEDKVVIVNKRHGRKHTAVLTMRDLVDRMRRLPRANSKSD